MKKALGRGLDALIPEITPSVKTGGEEIQKIPVEKIKPSKYQPRKKFDNTKINELADSIKKRGVIQPLVVSPSPVPGEYELVAGERRLRASRIAGLKEVPVIIRHTAEKEKFQISLIENLQREDLNPVEEARAYQNIMKEFNITQEELSGMVSKDRSVVANTVRLLGLGEKIQDMIESGLISAGHARVLAGIDDRNRQNELANEIIRKKLTVREIEELVQEWKQTSSLARHKKHKRAPEVIDLENKLQTLLGTKVRLISRGKKGKIIIFFYSLDDLDRLLLRLKKTSRK